MDGQCFSEAFKELGIQQKYIARKTGISMPTLAQLFTGLRRLQGSHAVKLTILLDSLEKL